MLVKNGTYTEHVTISQGITVAAYPGHAPIIDGSDTTVPVFTVTASATLRGLRIKGSKALPMGIHFQEVNVLISGSAVHLTVEDCEIYDYNHCGIKGNGRFTIRRTEIRDGGYEEHDHAIYISAGDVGAHLIENSYLHGSSGYGLHAYPDEYNITFQGNVVTDNAGGILVTGDGHRIYNNTSTYNHTYNGLIFYQNTMSDTIVQNNLVYGNEDNDLDSNNAVFNSGFVMNHNCYATQNSASMVGAGDVTSDPLFVDATPDTWQDVALQAGSPCRGAGVNLGADVRGLDAGETALTAKAFATWDIGAIAR